ncbi:hypothetical protein V8F33_010272 [Rhypophila sp. PSN 637]
MGVEGKKRVPPLPAPTETESTFLSEAPSDLGTDLGTDVSKPGDEKSSYSLPEDGTPVTIKTGHRASRSQTSLLIEYFEAGKGTAGSASEERKPSVRVRLTPSSKHKSKSGADRGRIQITETKSRKSSVSRKSRPEPETLSALSGDFEDASSYASATEESNVSRNPIDIEIDRGGNVRRRRPASPLIPPADSISASNSKTSYFPATMSDISAIPTDSFLDGSGPTTSTFKMSEVKSSRSRSPTRAGDILAGAAAGLAGAAAADKLRSKSRGEGRDRDRVVVAKQREKDKERKHRSSKGRTSSLSKEERHVERPSSPRRRSGKGPADSLISGAESSIISSALSPSHRSMDQHSIRSTTSKASSINNPKLLETVEDAIRRLILPELNALKREQSRHKDRRGSTTSSTTTASREDYASDRRRSSGTDRNVTPRDSLKVKEKRDREARNDFDDSPAQSVLSQDTFDDRHLDDTPMRSNDRLKAAAAGIAIGAAAVAAHEAMKTPTDDKRTRRRRRAEMRGRASDQGPDDNDSDLLAPPPHMPLMSDVNASDVTRASILSADSDRPHSASEELTPGRDITRDQLSAESSPTPTRTPGLQALGAQHANVSHGDLRALPRQRGLEQEDQEHEYDRSGPSSLQEYDDEDYDEPGPTPSYGSYGGYYDTQDVPPPLNYVPYQPERRGLSPIPSVSGYTEGGSEAPNRESRLTERSESFSSPEKSPRHDRSMASPTSARSNAMSREYADDDQSLRSSGVDQVNRMSAADSELERVTSGQAVRAVGANPDFVHAMGIESNVASLVDGSMLEESVLTTDSSALGQNPYNARESMATLEEERSRGHATPTKRSVGSHHEYLDERGETPVSARSQRSREIVEYDIDEYGRKVPRTYRNSPTASEQAIASAAVGAAAAIMRAQNGKGKQVADEVRLDNDYQPAGVQRNQSFKERAKNGLGPGFEPKHSVDRLVDEHENPKLGFSSIPDPNNPEPEYHNWQDDDELTNPSLLNGQSGKQIEQDWHGDMTPRQRAFQPEGDVDYQSLDDRHASPSDEQKGGHGISASEAVAAGVVAGAAAAALAQSHSRQVSQEHEEEWYRTSEDRKRDTLVTNPYEGTSPIANLPGINDNLLGAGGYGEPDFTTGFNPRSPLGHKVDEGYQSQGPNRTPDGQNIKGKGVDFNLQPGAAGDDPFYTPKHSRHLSGMSQGLESPLYDAATGAGIDRIESKDIIALMQHLMVRDAQRSARDTEILVTLVRSATEMRNNMEDLKRLLADTEDVIITEVKENTDKSVQRAINGPRPYPGSAARSIQGGSAAGTINGDDINAKKRSIFRRALKGLGTKGANDLGRIEVMLNQLLTEVDVLKAQTAPGTSTLHSPQNDQMLYDDMQPEGQYEQDHGYEPEGNAGTSTASHGSQSGHLSIQSRGTSGKLGYDRRQSGNRISTVPEAEEEYDHVDDVNEITNYSKPELLMTPAHDQRGSSAPLATPPQSAHAAQTSLSNENTPRTEEGKKNKSARSSWIPKISRWSESTSGSVAGIFRRSGQSRKNEDDSTPYQTAESSNFHRAPSHSGSIGSYSDNFQFSDPHATIKTDKLHTGFSEQDLTQDLHEDDQYQLQPPPTMTETPMGMNFTSMTPEDPKYKAHRNSLNLQHPQPRQGQTERFKAALENQAMGFGSPLSPKSTDWAGSATSLNRFPHHENRDSYSSATGEQQGQYQQHWTSSPAQANVVATSGPPRPPKEPITDPGSPGPVQNKRLSKLQKPNPGSPLPHHSVESGYGTMTQGVPTASYISHGGTGRSSPRLENRNLSNASSGNGVARRPSGPRPMTPSRGLSGVSSPLGSHGSGSRHDEDVYGSGQGRNKRG